MASIASQVPKNLSFRYRIACRKIPAAASAKTTLDESYRLPNFSELEDMKPFAEVRMGWDSGGLVVWVEVKGKSKSLWCRESAILESDGVQVWVDTRDTHNVHRATKFCHWFIGMPTGGGAKKDKPIGNMLKINRSREDSPTLNRQKISVTSKVSKTGYQMTLFIPAKALNGWNVEEQRQLGFNVAVIDSEKGWQTLAIGPELPISEDPSLWQTVQLVD
jgi:hypothetical protein